MNIFLRFPEGRAKALTLSYDDGVKQDERFIGILDKHGLKGTFNINSAYAGCEGRLSVEKMNSLLEAGGHELAVHGATHPFLEQLPLALAIDDVLTDRKKLEEETGKIIRGMAYPYGTFSDDLASGLRAIGIAYSRTVISTGNFRLPTDWLKLAATCHHNDKRLPELTQHFINDSPNRAPWLFYLWGHSYEFDNNNNWNVIEDFAEKIGGKEDIWYATNIEIYDYITAYNRLQFSASGSRVHNPSAIKIWFEKNGKAVSVNPGETVKI
ncbi:MAG: polysaccharide deacetylase family protein [Clostridia bacterium]|nr:polysaccharide deacetylase family protein [Clostridia bacterium]